MAHSAYVPTSRPAAIDRHRSRGLRIRWSALATGSLVGIAAWASLYVLGGALAWSLSSNPAAAGPLAHALMSGYGALMACFALALASYVATRAGGVEGRGHALLYGACLWSLSSITLVAVATVASFGGLAQLPSEVSAVVDVGLAAIGLQAQPQGTVSPAGALWGMLTTLALSFVFAARGALRAYDQSMR